MTSVRFHHHQPRHNLRHSVATKTEATNSRIVYIVQWSIVGIVLVLVSVVYLVNNLPNRHFHGPAPLHTVVRARRFRLQRQPEYRVAFLLPFVGSAVDRPAYLSIFCLGAAAAAPVADFFVLHTGGLASPEDCPPNVFFINLQSTVALAEYLVRVVVVNDDPAEEVEPKQEATDANVESKVLDRQHLVQIVARILEIHPYCLVEFKPALGFLFQDFIRSNEKSTRPLRHYTHWGYSDLDILFGDLSSWLTRDELQDFDIVTYGFGDQQRLYLRGQFTIHKNDDRINQLWRSCEYLTNLDQRLSRILQGHEKFRFESAEGCYSAAILQRHDIKVKFATKAWTDISRHDTSYTDGIYFHRQSYPAVLSKKASTSLVDSFSSSSVTTDELLKLSRNQSIDFRALQIPIGNRIPLDLPDDPTANCLYWVQQKYQRHMCLKQNVGANETLYWINGQLYRQYHVNNHQVSLANDNDDASGRVTAPYFHFQEWKRYYRPSQLTAMHYSSTVSDFVLTKEGAIPIMSEDRYVASKSLQANVSPLFGQSTNRFWFSRNSQDQALSALTSRSYCLISGPRKFPPLPPTSQCYRMTSWRDDSTVELLSAATEWHTLMDIQTQVTLVLTAQISSERAQDLRALSAMIESVVINLERWQGQPSVVVLHVAGVNDDAVNFLRNRFQTDLSLDNALIALVKQSDGYAVSRKALLNMAMDAVPTRWYVSGVELERGLVLSLDTIALAHYAAAQALQNSMRGLVFLIPQFASMGTDSRLGLRELTLLQEKKVLKRPQDVEYDKCEEDNIIVESSEVENLWWKRVESLFFYSREGQLGFADSPAKRAETMSDLELSLFEMLTDDQHLKMFAMDQSPILLIDNVGPHPAMRTNELVREVEELGGLRCYNGLRLSQLAAFGYRFEVLGGAFAISTLETRQALQLSEQQTDVSRCDGCYMFGEEHEDILENIIKDEIRRPGKAAVLWREGFESER